MSGADCAAGRAGSMAQAPDMGKGSRSAMLMQVMRAGFAVDDAQLFLDTHPCDTGAMAYYQQAAAAYKEAADAYAAAWGPLFAVMDKDTAYWSWMNDPWPWEGGMS